MRYRVAEFFSGIGGWHRALERSGVEYDVVAAFDINEGCNRFYEENYSLQPTQKSIDRLSIKELDALSCNLWVMSPPCQPFTRNNQTENRDTVDPRCAAFLHLLQALSPAQSDEDSLATVGAGEGSSKRPPRVLSEASRPIAILLENVVGFETSQACAAMQLQLSAAGYRLEQFHLCPSQLGIPNVRPRYYAMAIAKGAEMPF